MFAREGLVILDEDVGRCGDVAFLLRNTVCAAGPRFRPGRAAFKANGPSRVLGQTSGIALSALQHLNAGV